MIYESWEKIIENNHLTYVAHCGKLFEQLVMLRL